jgi:uncharacterized membrane protein YkoI
MKEDSMRTMIIAAALIASAATAVQAQSKISAASAREIALQRVPDNTGIISEKLQVRDGILVYEFDVDVPGRTHREIRVNAQTGVVTADQKEDDRITGASSRTVPIETPAPVTVGKPSSHEPYNKDDKPSMVAVSEATARAIALRTLPTGTITDVDLERENGLAVWEIDVTLPGEKGFRELIIDANTGHVVTQRIRH